MLDIPLWTPEIFQANESECREILKDMRNWRKIPLLNHTALHELSDFSIVRFRGMVQDMLQPEIYLERYDVKSNDNSVRTQNGKYRDCLVVHPNESVDLESTSNIHGERQTIFVVSIPGINVWATDFEKSANPRKQQSLKNEGSTKNLGIKRSVCENDEDMEVDTPGTDEVRKKVKNYHNSSNIGESSSCLLSSEYLLNSPIPDRPSKACMVKMYCDFEGHALNSIIDVVGFLSVNPALDGTTEEVSEFDDIIEHQATNPPPSLIPRLHALVVKSMEHNNPLMDGSLVDSDYNTINTEAVHNDLKILLTQCLFGDAMAAEYLLSHLISTIYVRTELETLGQFTLNICNIPKEALPEYTSVLYEIIESLLPVSHYLPLTLENINTLQFMPKKDYNTNKLTSGLLQLAPHTHLVLDETQLHPGKVESNGIETVRNLSHLINKQQIKCDFKYYELDYNTNIPVLILSEAKSMLPSNFIVPLKPDQECTPLIMETLKAAKHYLQPKLNNIRKYLTAARIQNFSMNSTDTEMIENDFVEMRKLDKTFGPDGLHSLLVLARLLGVAKGKTVMDKESWQSAKDMEVERKRRFALLNARRL